LSSTNTTDVEIHERFWQQTQKLLRKPEIGPCIEWTGSLDRDGYGRFRIRRGGVMLIDAKAHRYSFELANGYMPKLVEHRCDNPPCVNPQHLQPGSHKTNGQDASARGLLVHRPKVLTDEDRREILRLRAEGLSYPALCEEFGVSYETIRRVLVKGPQSIAA
jgi:hypothetical protein